jgi:hypothetical protein
MKFTKLTVSLATLALAVASAASSHYNLTLDSAQWVGDKQLKAGDYKVEISGDKAVFKSGKTVVEVPATLQTNGQKYMHTSYASVDSKIKEIDLGGTNTKIMLGSASSGADAGGK